MVPKNIALAEPVRTALVLGPPLVALTRALRPVIFAVNALANGLLKLLRVETQDEVAAAFSDEELAQMVKDSGDAGLLDDRATGAAAGRAGAGPPPGPGRGAARWSSVVSARSASRRRGWSGWRPSPASPASRWSTTTRRILGYLHVKDALDADGAGLPFRLPRCGRSPGSGPRPRWTTS